MRNASATTEQNDNVKLPVNRVFVLQLDAATGKASNRFAGRLEHVASGEVVHFESQQDMIQFITRLFEEQSSSDG